MTVRFCGYFSCKLNSVANLKSALALYVDEHSQVIFKKEHMHNKSWWLSAFCSLCIQSKVRRVLIELLNTKSLKSKAIPTKQYLHLAVQLFIVTSGKHDHLMQASSDESMTAKVVADSENYDIARYATQQETWKNSGIMSSADCLFSLFAS